MDDDPADQSSKAGDQSYRAFAQQMANALARAHRRAPGVRSYECSVHRGRDGWTGGEGTHSKFYTDDQAGNQSEVDRLLSKCTLSQSALPPRRRLTAPSDSRVK